MVYDGMCDFVQWIVVHDGNFWPNGQVPDDDLRIQYLKTKDGRLSANVLKCGAIMVKR